MVVAVAVVLDVAALLILGWARPGRARPGRESPERWSRTGLLMIAVSLLLLSAAVWLASVPG